MDWAKTIARRDQHSQVLGFGMLILDVWRYLNNWAVPNNIRSANYVHTSGDVLYGIKIDTNNHNDQNIGIHTCYHYWWMAVTNSENDRDESHGSCFHSKIYIRPF